MTDYLARTMQLFPGLGVRLSVFLLTAYVLQSLLWSCAESLLGDSILLFVLVFPPSILLWFYGHTVALLLIRDHFAGEHLPLPNALAEAGRLYPRILLAWALPMLFILLGFLLIVPGIILMMTYYFITHEIVFCNAEASEAKEMSVRDTEGRRMLLFLIGLVVSIPMIAFTMALVFLLDDFSFPPKVLPPAQAFFGELLSNLIAAVINAVIYIATTLVFYDAVAARTNNPEEA